MLCMSSGIHEIENQVLMNKISNFDTYPILCLIKCYYM